MVLKRSSPLVAERSNPLLNQIFSQFTLAELSRLLKIDDNAVMRWKYVPEEHIERVATYCEIDPKKIYENTAHYMNVMRGISAPHETHQASLDVAHGANKIVKDNLKRARQIVAKLRKDESVKVWAEALSDIVGFIEDNPAIWAKYRDRHVARIKAESVDLLEYRKEYLNADLSFRSR